MAGCRMRDRLRDDFTCRKHRRRAVLFIRMASEDDMTAFVHHLAVVMDRRIPPQ
jgi:hypothetical protein